jgi:hypothetical protein
MLRRVAPVGTDVSEELSASIFRVTRIGELGTTLALTSNRRTLRINTSSVRLLLVTASGFLSSPILVTLMMEAKRSSETSILTRATRRNIPEDGILLCCCLTESSKYLPLIRFHIIAGHGGQCFFRTRRMSCLVWKRFIFCRFAKRSLKITVYYTRSGYRGNTYTLKITPAIPNNKNNNNNNYNNNVRNTDQVAFSACYTTWSCSTMTFASPTPTIRLLPLL